MLPKLERGPGIHYSDDLKRVGYPPGVEQYKNEIVVTSHGPLTFASHPFAPVLTNEGLLELTGFNGDDRARAQAIINATGVTHRHMYKDAPHLSLEEITDRSAAIGALLIKKAMQRKGWNSIDHLIVSSAFLPLEVAPRVLERAGLDSPQVTWLNYRLACAGLVTGIVDAFASKSLQDKHVAAVALEPLSFLMQLEHFTNLENLTIPSIFGDDNAAVLFTPSDYELLSAKTYVEYDGGVIKLKTAYPQPPHQQSAVPSYYEIAENARERLSVSERGVCMDIDVPDHGLHASMNGEETGMYFGTTSTPLLKDVIKEHGHPEQIGYVVAHTPSGPVARKINQKNRIANLGIPEILFLLPDAKRSNSSSATTCVMWQHMARERLINPNATFLLYAPGIGSTKTAAILRRKQKKPL